MQHFKDGAKQTSFC